MTEFVWSWPTRADSVVPDVTSGLAKCTKYTMAINHETYRWAAKRLPVRGVADGIALRFDASIDGDSSDVVLYVAYLVRGGTVLDLEASGERITDAVFTQLVSKAAARLNAAVD
ncbi:hypothetical protein [Kribbella sp. NPDC000426]|uniref:hypothetical protein n=1 Tax=Kribbella sp. NPDC000426 TaxID=3154255 RepID=UPI003324BD00